MFCFVFLTLIPHCFARILSFLSPRHETIDCSTTRRFRQIRHARAFNTYAPIEYNIFLRIRVPVIKTSERVRGDVTVKKFEKRQIVRFFFFLNLTIASATTSRSWPNARHIHMINIRTIKCVYTVAELIERDDNIIL